MDMAKKTENESTVDNATESQAEVIAQAGPAAPATQVENEAAPEPAPNPPQTIDALAVAYRVPAWQAAALNRFMGWEPGKMVSEADFVVALHSLDARRMGGGCKE